MVGNDPLNTVITVFAIVGDIFILIMLLWILYPWFVAKMNEPEQTRKEDK